jgi:glycosyltransferase involved in cell wall biosynthesis
VPEILNFMGLLTMLRNMICCGAYLVLMPKGWGLVVTEANAMGTPVDGYDIPGLRDSISNGILRPGLPLRQSHC